MENKITKGIIGFGFLVLMAFTLMINSNKLEQNDVTLENIVALNQAQAECGYVYTCGWVSYEKCWEQVYPYYDYALGVLVSVTWECD